MIHQSLDISKLGFRWTGEYNTSKSYVDGDVAFKDGFAKAYINSTWTDFGVDQRDLSNGELLLKDQGANGLPGQNFLVRNDGTVGFDTPALRTGTLASSLGGQTEHYSHNKATVNCWHALMSDGSVRGVGLNEDGQLGVGEDGIFVRPVTVPFPRNKKIVRVINGYKVTYFITDNGELFACGEDLFYGGYGLSSFGIDHAKTPVNLSELTDLSGEVVTDVITNFADTQNTISASSLVLTQSGKVYVWGNNSNGLLGLGHTNIVSVPELLYWTEFIPIQKAYILNSPSGGASYLIDFTGKMYVAGDDDASLFNAADISTHKLLNPWGTSKRVIGVRTNSSRHYSTIFSYWVSNQRSVMLILEDTSGDREVYGRGEPGLSWNRSLTNASYWKIGETDVRMFGSGSIQKVTSSMNVRDVAFFTLTSLQAVLTDSSGFLYHLGDSTYWKTDSTDISPSHNVWYQYDPTIAFDITKFYCSFSHGALTMVALRGDGVVITAGYNGDPSARLNGNSNHGGVEIPPLPFHEKVVDIFISGENVSDLDNSGAAISQNNRQVILLTETGEVYAGGENSQGTLGKGTLTSSQTFQKVHF